jgi:competence protein ComEC
MPTTQWTAANSIPFLCAFVIAGAAFYSVFAPAPSFPILSASVGTDVVIEGIVSRDPDTREKFIFLTIDVDSVNGTTGEGRILASVDRFSEVSYGDRVLISGKLSLPERFETDNGRAFDYPKYLLAHGITHTVQFADVEVRESGKGNPIVGVLLGLKHALLSGIQKALLEPESALLAGLLLGEKQSLGEKITESFRNAGVVHIIVLSGYNVALVIAAILFLAQRIFSRGIALAVAGVGIIAFVVMTGASETGVRASVMALIVLLAQFLRRPTEGVRILLIAGAGMALFNPYLVLFDLSYQLSMLATLGLVLFSNPLQKRMQFVPESFGLREIVSTTLATQVTVLPLLIFSIGSVSIVSLFANILVLPAVPAAMLLGFMASVVSLLSTTLALPFTTLAYAILHYIIQISVWLGSFSFSSFLIPTEHSLEFLGVLLTLYALTFLFLLRRN